MCYSGSDLPGLAVRAFKGGGPGPARGDFDVVDGGGPGWRRGGQLMSRKPSSSPSSAGAGGRRLLKTRVKSAKKRSSSSTQWLRRQLNDPYVAAARREGYRSRAAYKLIEVDDRHKILKPGLRVLDLGCTPGGWCQVAAQRVGPAGRVYGIDLLDMGAVPGVDFLRLDFMTPEALEKLRQLTGGSVDVVLSDMAPAATGHKRTDHLQIMGLAEAALEFALELLAPGGTFLAKVLQGGSERALLNVMKRDFARLKHVKPKASRADSSELYVLATGFRGGFGGA